MSEEILTNNSEFEFVNIIHPSVVLEKNVKLGMGIMINALCCISSGSIIEDF